MSYASFDIPQMGYQEQYVKSRKHIDLFIIVYLRNMRYTYAVLYNLLFYAGGISESSKYRSIRSKISYTYSHLAGVLEKTSHFVALHSVYPIFFSLPNILVHGAFSRIIFCMNLKAITFVKINCNIMIEKIMDYRIARECNL